MPSTLKLYALDANVAGHKQAGQPPGIVVELALTQPQVEQAVTDLLNALPMDAQISVIAERVATNPRLSEACLESVRAVA